VNRLQIAAAARARRRRQGGPSIPRVALAFESPYWEVDDANTVRPPAFVTSDDGGATFDINDGVASGLALSVEGGNLYVEI
jgi:hypothetical protein